MNWKSVIMLTIMFLQATGCYRIYHKSGLTLQNEPFDQRKISFRTDGYYYRELEVTVPAYVEVHGGKTPAYRGMGVQPIFFYDDGYVKYVSGYYRPSPLDTLLSKKEQITSVLAQVERRIHGEAPRTYKKNPRYSVWDWGLYRQKGDSLQIQYYFNHFGAYRLMNLDAIILNDSTLKITNEFSPFIPKAPGVINMKRNDLYKFRKYNFKPDSATYLRDRIDRFGK